ncbi:MAG: hypothetical protein H3Z52_13635 [archaeon]|nr:hypothetical protein [archaeon]
MAWSVVIASLPSVIKDIKDIILKINELAKKSFTQKDALKEQNKKLIDALEKLKDSMQKIGISIRDYEGIYTAALQAETAAKALMDVLRTSSPSIWKAALPSNIDETVRRTFQELKDLDGQLKKTVDAKKGAIETEDYDKINSIRSDVQDFFNRAENHLRGGNNVEAADDVEGILKKLGEISSVIKARFDVMSNTLIKIVG